MVQICFVLSSQATQHCQKRLEDIHCTTAIQFTISIMSHKEMRLVFLADTAYVLRNTVSTLYESTPCSFHLKQHNVPKEMPFLHSYFNPPWIIWRRHELSCGMEDLLHMSTPGLLCSGLQERVPFLIKVGNWREKAYVSEQLVLDLEKERKRKAGSLVGSW